MPDAPDDRCGAKTRAGGTCNKPAGYGTDHLGFGRCKFHGGSTPNGRKHGAELAALHHIQVMGVELDIEPLDALLWCVRVAAGEVTYSTDRIRELEPHDAVGNPLTVKTRPLSLGKEGEAAEITVEERTSAPPELNVWIRIRHDALERLAKFSKMALDAGVAERQVRLAERYGELLAGLIGGILGDLELSAAQREMAPQVVRRHMALLEAGGA